MRINDRDYLVSSQDDRSYQLLLEAIPDIMLRLNRAGVCLDFHVPQSVAFRLFSAGVDWRGKFLWEILPPHLAAQRMVYVERAIVTNEVQVYEQELEVDGQWQYEEVRVTRCNEQEALVIVRDISARKYAQIALQRSEARFQRLAANVPGVLYQFRLSLEGKVSFPYISAYSQELFELEPEQVYRNSDLLMNQVHPDDQVELWRSIWHSAATLQPCTWLGRLTTPSGRLIWIQKQSRPERQADGSVLWDGVILNITEGKLNEEALRRSEAQLRQQAIDLENTLQDLKRTQTQLIHSEKMSSLGQLVAGIAHEINNPISFIYGNLCHANDYVADIFDLIHLYQKHHPQPHPEVEEQIAAIDLEFISSDLDKLLSSMQTGAERIQDIVLSLRTFSRLDEAALKRVNIHDGIESTLTILQSRLNQDYQGYKLKVTRNYAELPRIECFAGSLNQVFLQIITNAIDALEVAIQNPQWLVHHPQPTIEIYTEQVDAEQVRIRILDNGMGIAESEQARMFDPFFTTKPIGQGTGMGLAMSYQIVTQQHHGSLKCRSIPLQGAELVVTLPIRQVEVQSQLRSHLL
ncbi:ATP-binding protein [Leptolyngbya sp. FACHB-17]|uniref:PAS domain-containing sensor histidine kinase n=1 Tax=unclassified Leptolyngbya TaxID=2650499 RepID=UPI001680B273|nr:ATP-binding protein [Leptolyngbya sp. FACHB-17]MBD2081839.1 PAS domain-containing protein [Leptolyngbya sp. FACHB-17]